MVLEVAGLEGFIGRSQVLRRIDLRVGEGELVCLLGRNGAGKTTTLRAILGALEEVRGLVSFRGRSIAGRPPYEVARLGIAWVPQDRRIFPDLTVHENLQVAAAYGKGRPGGWDIGRVYSIFPELARMARRRGSHLSGGEQRMLAIARALLLNPSLLLLDEPTDGLAPRMVERVEAVVRQIVSAGIPILLAEQNVRFAARLAHKGYIIEKGEIRAEGAVAELLADERTIGRYLAL